MLDHMDGLQPIEGGIGERVRIAVQIADHVRPAGRIAVNPNGVGQLVDSTSDVQNSHGRDDCSLDRSTGVAKSGHADACKLLIILARARAAGRSNRCNLMNAESIYRPESMFDNNTLRLLH